jgi:hypothetical protein
MGTHRQQRRAVRVVLAHPHPRTILVTNKLRFVNAVNVAGGDVAQITLVAMAQKVPRFGFAQQEYRFAHQAVVFHTAFAGWTVVSERVADANQAEPPGSQLCGRKRLQAVVDVSKSQFLK